MTEPFYPFPKFYIVTVKDETIAMVDTASALHKAVRAARVEHGYDNVAAYEAKLIDANKIG